MTKKDGTKVWVAVRGVGFGDDDLVVSTTLKGVCDVIGFSYGSVKRKVDGGFGPIWLSGKVDGGKEGIGVAWLVRKVDVVKVIGRGDEDRFKKVTGGNVD